MLRKAVKDAETRLLHIQETLLDGVSVNDLVDLVKDLSMTLYKEVVEERSVEGICGYPACQNKISADRKRAGRYRISLSQHRVFDARESEMFCCDEHTTVSNGLLAQLPETAPCIARLRLSGTAAITGGAPIIEERTVTFAEPESANRAGPAESSDESEDGTDDVEQEEHSDQEVSPLPARPRKTKVTMTPFGTLWVILSDWAGKEAREFVCAHGPVVVPAALDDTGQRVHQERRETVLTQLTQQADRVEAAMDATGSGVVSLVKPFVQCLDMIRPIPTLPDEQWCALLLVLLLCVVRHDAASMPANVNSESVLRGLFVFGFDAAMGAALADAFLLDAPLAMR